MIVTAGKWRGQMEMAPEKGDRDNRGKRYSRELRKI